MLDRPFVQPDMGSNSSHFSHVPGTNFPRSVFNRSSGLKTTFDSGYIVPIYVDEVLPGDSVKMHVSSFIRLQPTVVPPMDNLTADVFWFLFPIVFFGTSGRSSMAPRIIRAIRLTS